MTSAGDIFSHIQPLVGHVPQSRPRLHLLDEVVAMGSMRGIRLRWLVLAAAAMCSL